MENRISDFGRRTWNLDVQIAGNRTKEQFCADQELLVDFLDMDRAGMDPDVRSYPLPDGRGGEGLTIMQPYVEPERRTFHQPLTTSFLIIDSWPEHFTLTIKSCVEFSAAAVLEELRRLYGREAILDCHAWTLGQVIHQRRGFCGGGGK